MRKSAGLKAPTVNKLIFDHEPKTLRDPLYRYYPASPECCYAQQAELARRPERLRVRIVAPVHQLHHLLSQYLTHLGRAHTLTPHRGQRGVIRTTVAPATPAAGARCRRRLPAPPHPHYSVASSREIADSGGCPLGNGDAHTAINRHTRRQAWPWRLSPPGRPPGRRR